MQISDLGFLIPENRPYQEWINIHGLHTGDVPNLECI